MLLRFGREYGAGPAHLLAALASFAVAGYAIVQIKGLGGAGSVAVWFVGAIIAHDLVLLPLYSLAGGIAARLTGVRGGHPARVGAPPPVHMLRVNHLRVPVMISGLLFLLFFPSILQLSSGYEGASGQSASPYLGRWLLLTALLFAGSGLLYAVRHPRSAQAYREEPAAERARVEG